MSLRREFDLLPPDAEFLDQYGLPWGTIVDGAQWVLIHDFPSDEGYNHPTVSIAIRLETGYPQAALDMVYVYPHLARKDGKPIPQTDNRQAIDRKQWQRWSRHRTNVHPWRPGQDSLETHIYLIEDWFAREFEQR